MEYLFVGVILIITSLGYFRIAEYCNIVDRPNQRSSHIETTIRGGGIIFLISIFLYQLMHQQAPLLLLVGLFSIGLISFLDDIYNLPNSLRLCIHLMAVTCLIVVTETTQVWPLWAIPVIYILVVGSINAYNFMDGINGITGVYSLIAFCSLLYINIKTVYIDSNLIIYGIIACFVFLIFNFRTKAKCFAGDVGSVSVAFWIISLILLLIIKTQEYKFILFLTVYGIDTVFTLAHRIIRKENIFEAHRLHLYQLLANVGKISHLRISSVYAFLQLVINIFVICTSLDIFSIFLISTVPLAIIYLLLKNKFMKQLSFVKR